jgi:hypothetical protein
MGTVKVVCIKQCKVLEGILDMGDEVEIVTKVSSEDVLHQVKRKNPKGEGTIIVNETFIPKGNYEGWSFVSKNGMTYNNQEIQFKLQDLFKKI